MALTLQSSATKRILTQGFTIIELVITTAVLAILSVIVAIAYNGITNRTLDNALKSDLRTVASQIELERMNSGSYPENIDDFIDNEDVVLEYAKNRTQYCVTASSLRTGSSYFLGKSTDEIAEGVCEEIPPFNITSDSKLPNAYLNILAESVPYSYSLTTDKGGPVSFNVSSGSLPSGLSLNSANGMITGQTTSPPGVSNFAVTATSGSDSVTKDFSIINHPFDSCNDPLPASATPTITGQTLTIQMQITLCGRSSPEPSLPQMQAFKIENVEGATPLFLGTISNGYLISNLTTAEACNGVRVRYIFYDFMTEWTDIVKSNC